MILLLILIIWIVLDIIYTIKYKFCRNENRACRNWKCKHSSDCYFSIYCKVGDGDYYLPEMEREYKKSLKYKER